MTMGKIPTITVRVAEDGTLIDVDGGAGGSHRVH